MDERMAVIILELLLNL